MTTAQTTIKTVNGITVEVILSADQPRSEVAQLKSNGSGGCYLCNKKVGKNGYFVHMSVSGDLLPIGTGIDFGNESQGLFEIGSECRKNLPKNFTMKKEVE
jgi:hypothetical protein